MTTIRAVRPAVALTRAAAVNSTTTFRSRDHATHPNCRDYLPGSRGSFVFGAGFVSDRRILRAGPRDRHHDAEACDDQAGDHDVSQCRDRRPPDPRQCRREARPGRTCTGRMTWLHLSYDCESIRRPFAIDRPGHTSLHVGTFLPTGIKMTQTHKAPIPWKGVASGFVAASALFLVCDLLAADAPPPVIVKQAFQEKLPNVPGKTLTGIHVTYAPGGKSSAHAHAGSVYAYVLSGKIRSENSVTGPRARVLGRGRFFRAAGQRAYHQRERQRDRAGQLAGDLRRR